MKKILVMSILCLSSMPALAQTCSSLWVYQPYKTCAAAANGPDLSQGQMHTQPKWYDTGWVGGGHNQSAECEGMRKQLDENQAARAIRGEVLNTGEDSKKDFIGHAQYLYKCLLQSKAYPYLSAPNGACGREDRWASEEVGKSLEGLNGSPVCLSCDNVTDDKGVAACLKVTIDQVIVPRAVTLRPEELAAVNARIETIKKSQSFTPTLSTDEKAELVDLQAKVAKAMADLH